MAKQTQSPAAGEAPGYEQARDELVEVVRRLEAGGTGLEESLALWERGEALAAVCEQWLAGARARLDAVKNQTKAQIQVQGQGQGQGQPD
jgi:exodeoxyribonuclease VII small subunit